MEGRIIALLDDDPDIISTLSDYLRYEGFKVEGFTRAEDFLAFLEKTVPDLIIMDQTLPDMNGFEVCGILKKYERFSAIPVIMLSGRHIDPDSGYDPDAGPDEYLIKPIPLDKLVDLINSVFTKKNKN